jgi:ketosteroid isomerase-like protein
MRFSRLAAAAMTAAVLVSGTPAAAQGPAVTRHGTGVRVANEFYEALEAKDIERFARLWTEDAVYRVPVTPEGVPGVLVGRDAIVAGLNEFFQLFGDTDFTWTIEPMRDPNKVLATWSLDIELVAGGRYLNEGAAIFQLERGRIADFTEYFDTAGYLEIFGTD